MRKLILAAVAAVAMFGGSSVATTPKAEAGVVVKFGHGGYHHRPKYRHHYYKPRVHYKPRVYFAPRVYHKPHYKPRHHFKKYH